MMSELIPGVYTNAITGKKHLWDGTTWQELAENPVAQVGLEKRSHTRTKNVFMWIGAIATVGFVSMLLVGALAMGFGNHFGDRDGRGGFMMGRSFNSQDDDGQGNRCGRMPMYNNGYGWGYGWEDPNGPQSSQPAPGTPTPSTP